MDLDRYLEAHRADWDRLDALVASARRDARSMDPAEADELVRRYQRTAGQLSHVRAAYGDPSLEAELTRLVAEANAVILGTPGDGAAGLRRFASVAFPFQVWRLRWFVLVAAVATLLPAVVVGAWIATSDAALDAAGPEAVRAAYVEQDFAAYYSSEPAAQFAADVTFNNIRVSVTAFAIGVLGCVGTAGLLAFNGANVGVAGGLFHAVGEWDRFWGLILPHGLLELTAVIIAGAAGLRLGWAVIDPGDRHRAQALAEEGRASVIVVLGLAAAFVVAGLIEGFVTGSPLPTAVRVGIGVLVEVAFVAYIVRLGRAEEARASSPAGPRTA